MRQFFFNRFFKLKNVVFLLLFFCSIKIVVAQKGPNELVKYSHTQFIKLLTSNKDSVFNLTDAYIYFDKDKDSSFYYQTEDINFLFPKTDSLIIDAKISLENVHFEHRFNADYGGAALHHIRFNKEVNVLNTASIVFSNCVFEKGLSVDVNIPMNTYIDDFELNYDNYSNDIAINESIVKGNYKLDIGTIETYSSLFVNISSSTFSNKMNEANTLFINNITAIDFIDNKFLGEGLVQFYIDTCRETQFSYNDFGNQSVLLHQKGIIASSMNFITDNIYRNHVMLELDDFSKTDTYRWNEWANKVISYHGYSEYIRDLYANRALNSASLEALFKNDSILNTYAEKYKYQFENSYKSEKRLLGSFYDFYKSQYDIDFANDVYVTLKDLDTTRYEYLNNVEPSFKNYFTWKINQFLKVFSAYGTAPSKTVEISIYVIFIFAFIYMFFPNSWDTISQNRLMRRIRFYTRYFRNKESMKEIYQEEKKQDVMTFEEFKNYMNESKKETPSYFLWLAKPIYYFSSTNYNIISKLFDKTDLLKGKWVDLPKNKKILTSIFMGIWIFLLLIFDLLIKFINALTLSLNTFTTLGFGEIPTKGFPRYLSIIQGFIGWFMLSIFSVSLISQILN